LGFYPNAFEGVLRVVRKSRGRPLFHVLLHLYNQIFRPYPHSPLVCIYDGWSLQFSAFKVFFVFVDERLLVGIGVTSEGLTDQMEIIDLNNPDSYWIDIERFPAMLNNPIVGKSSGGSPIICGENMSFLFTAIFETIFGIISFRTTVKPEYNDHIWDF
jgi:hypothetical protein